MDWNEHVDRYCERTSDAFWAEPLGAASNIAYLVAAVAVWRMLSGRPGVPLSVGFMPPLMALIGAGSFAFHTLANRWSMLADVTPIGLFVLCFLASFLHWFHGMAWRRCLLGVAAFVGAAAAFGVLVGRHVPNGSGLYVPVLLAIVGITVALAASRDRELAGYWPAFAAAGAVFAGALFARTIDQEVCASVPVGTHFVWHILTGCLLFLVGRALVRRWRSLAGAGGQPAAVPGANGNRPRSGRDGRQGGPGEG